LEMPLYFRLGLEVRDSRPFVGGGDTRQDDVAYARRLGRVDRRGPLEGLLLWIDGEVRTKRGGHDEEAIDVPQERPKARLVGEVSEDGFGPEARDLRELRSIPRQSEDPVPPLDEVPCHRATLLSGRSCHQNRLRFRH